MRKMMSNRDAREVLQEEVNESVLRLKKAKFGHRLVDIVPDHKNSFYLPDKKAYIPKTKSKQSGIRQFDTSRSQLRPRQATEGNSPNHPARRPYALDQIDETVDVSASFITEPPNLMHATFQQRSNQQRNEVRNQTAYNTFGASPLTTRMKPKGTEQHPSSMRNSNMQTTTCETMPSHMRHMNQFQ